MPETTPPVLRRRPPPAALLTLGLGAGGDDVDLEAEIELGEFLCACPDLELQSCLGRGGMGIVFRARQVRLDRDVAVKLMNPQTSRDPEFARRFEREAKALARLDHPGIVRVHDAGQAAGVYYLVMELVDGPDLRELIVQGLSDAQASEIVVQLCDALAYAHQEGVVHRDIKPENVLLDRRGRVRVADFGLAKLRVEPRGGATRTRRVMGTPQYMAPEQLHDPEHVDERCDVFAIGVVFYEMLTGRLPVGRFPAPSELGRGNAKLDEIVLRALESSRERRFQTAGEIRAALSSIAAGSGATATLEGPPSRRRPRWPWGAGAAVAATALAWGVVASLDSTGDPTGDLVVDQAPSSVAAPPGPDPIPAAAKQLNRWPAHELAALDPDVVGVAGIDWSELRQSPLVTRVGTALLENRPLELQRCKEEVGDHTHKLVAAFTSTSLRELVIHGDWEPAHVRSCLYALARALRREGGAAPQLVESTLGPHERLVIHREGDQDVTVSIAHDADTVLISLRADITAEQLDAKLAGAQTSAMLRDEVIRSVDLSAPVWVMAEPTPGQLPWGMRSFRGGLELWDKLGVEASATFADEAAAVRAKTLVESYVNIVSAFPDLPSPPQLVVTQAGETVRVHGTLEPPDLAKARERGMRLDFGDEPPLAATTAQEPVVPPLR